MNRPEVSANISADEFLRWYWLKEELAVFCRLLKNSTSGSKPEMTQRIAAFLSGRPIAVTHRPVRKGHMPAQFELNSVIGEGWRKTAMRVSFTKATLGQRGSKCCKLGGPSARDRRNKRLLRLDTACRPR